MLFTGKGTRSSVAKALLVAIGLACSCWWVYGQSACTCIDVFDIKNFIKDQQAGKSAYEQASQQYKDQEASQGSPDQFTSPANQATIKASAALKTAALCSDPSTSKMVAFQGAATSAYSCTIGNYQYRIGCNGPTMDGSPTPCLKALVDAHEQVHVAACQRILSDKTSVFHWGYTSYESMAEFTDEEVQAHTAGAKNAQQILDQLQRNPCCGLTQPQSSLKPSLMAILRNLFS